MPLGLAIPVREVRRYWGYYGPVVHPDADAFIDEAVKALEKESDPRYVSRTFPVRIEGESVFLGDDTELKSSMLARNLKGCKEAVLLAATIGPACDRLAKRASLKSSALMSCYQAAGAAAIEAYVDFVNDKLNEEAKSKGLFPRPRFSPGYGDLALENQKTWFSLLNITRNTGITLTDSLLMLPTKSVTAIIGLSDKDTSCIRQGCEECNMSDTCEYSRKRDQHDS